MKKADTTKKDKDLDQILSDIEKQFGKGSIMKLGENQHMKVDVVSSGCLSLDIALGVGGYPRGRIIEIYGPESSGKTTFASKTEAEILKDITGFLQTIADATNEVEQANTLLLAPNAYAHLATTRLADSDRTLLEFVRQVNPNLTRIMKVGELKGSANDGSDMMVAGYFDPDYIKLEIPERFGQKPAERRNLETVINCTASVAGVTVAIPMAFVKAKGC